MSDVTRIPVGALPRATGLGILQALVAGTNNDPSVLFSQLKGIMPQSQIISVGGLIAPGSNSTGGIVGQDRKVCAILLASTLGVPLTQDHAPYFDCGQQWAGPEGGSIPAADADSITYGLYVFCDVAGVTFEGTEGAVRFAAQGSVLPNGLTIGWRISYGAFKAPTYSGATTLQGVPHLDAWCDKHVDDSGAHHGVDTLGDVRVSWSVSANKDNNGYTFMPVLVDQLG